jgi:hypothetical protein
MLPFSSSFFPNCGCSLSLSVSLSLSLSLSLIVLFNTIHVIQDIFFFLFFFLKPNLQVSVSKARAIIVLASDENADQVPILNVLMLLCGLYRFL